MNTPTKESPHNDGALEGPGSLGTTGNHVTKYFGAIPMPAFDDKRLKRSHLAVLGVVSNFDRFGKNGSGCYATHEQIGTLSACSRETVTRRLSDLTRWGYLEKVSQPGRKRPQYSVRYVSPGSHRHLSVVTSGSQDIVTNVSHKDRKKRYSAEAGDSGEPLQIDSAETGGKRNHLPPSPLKAKQKETITDGDLWGYRRRVSEALERGYQPGLGEIKELEQVREYAEGLGLDELAGAYEWLVSKASRGAAA
mgnify:CR=1 FL=1